MHSTDALRATGTDGGQASLQTRWLVAAGMAVVVLAASYILAVLTPGGQALENAALRGADQVNGDELGCANQTLDGITILSLAVAVAAVALIGLLRRRLDLAVAAVAVIVLGQVITQSLKRFILPRPALAPIQ